MFGLSYISFWNYRTNQVMGCNCCRTHTNCFWSSPQTEKQPLSCPPGMCLAYFSCPSSVGLLRKTPEAHSHLKISKAQRILSFHNFSFRNNSTKLSLRILEIRTLCQVLPLGISLGPFNVYMWFNIIFRVWYD